MSGGHFDYNQRYLQYIVEQIERDLVSEPDYYGVRVIYQPEVLEVMKQVKEEAEALYQKIHDLDWVISGDSSEEILEKYLT